MGWQRQDEAGDGQTALHSSSHPPFPFRSHRLGAFSLSLKEVCVQCFHNQHVTVEWVTSTRDLQGYPVGRLCLTIGRR
jgi:hypothetical protein